MQIMTLKCLLFTNYCPLNWYYNFGISTLINRMMSHGKGPKIWYEYVPNLKEAEYKHNI